MNREEFAEIINRGENDTIEFKEKLSSRINIAKLISSFANSYGGKILVGVGNKGKLLGVRNIRATIAEIHNVIQEIIKPTLKAEIETYKYDNKDVLIINIPQSISAPHAVDGVFYQRKGSFTHVASPERLEQILSCRITKSAQPNEVFKEEIHLLISQNAELYRKFNEAQSWKTKIIDYIFGALIGAVMAYLFRCFP